MASNCSQVTKKVINLEKEQTFTLLNMYFNKCRHLTLLRHILRLDRQIMLLSVWVNKSQSAIPLAGSLLGFPLLLFLHFLSQQRKSVHKVTTISQHHLSSEYSSPFPVLPVLISFSRTQTAHANHAQSDAGAPQLVFISLQPGHGLTVSQSITHTSELDTWAPSPWSFTIQPSAHSNTLTCQQHLERRSVRIMNQTPCAPEAPLEAAGDGYECIPVWINWFSL